MTAERREASEIILVFAADGHVLCTLAEAYAIVLKELQREGANR